MTFEYNKDYCFTTIFGTEEAKLLLGTHVHIFNKKCNCTADAIEIDHTGYFSKHVILPSGEVLIDVINEDSTKVYKYGSRTMWLYFRLID